MLLAQATSTAQVEAALAEGDEELSEDIEEKLKELKRRFDRGDTCEEDLHFDINDVFSSEDFLSAIREESPFDLSMISDEDLAREASHTRIFKSDDWRRRYRGGFSYSFNVPVTCYFHVPADDYYAGVEYIPALIAEDFFINLGYGLDWNEPTNKIADNYAWAEPYNDYYISASEEEFNEFCRDLFAEVVNTELRRDPDRGLERFFSKLPEYAAAALRAADIPKEELLDLASSFLAGAGEDADEVIETINEYLEAVKDPGVIERPVIQSWTQADLVAMGIQKGTLFEEAPWTLIKLLPGDLRLEGTAMRHCVGDKGMGYVRAVRDGEIEIWSLRSRANKPRFTLEVDASFYHPRSVDEPAERASAVKQVKGKANRVPGFADRSSTSLKFPEEVVFWANFFLSANAHPSAVGDLVPGLRAMSALVPLSKNPADAGFDAPYKPLGAVSRALFKYW